ncbi:MAG: 1-(5-phosphoribosyl)-5-[(5-phosphoribosylamino)methylideneamino]imidazole-4-carboxamide isomerase [Candidatus Omnitrophica bacterium]|nr:1-(5-phosphoribosyl)-5-[(5-phosphoribosylamino)methylideneamino]imidazole-4-carboxamide isomerase [Candidatus Omnitrophota bacterium]MDD5352596.1 1-(5-phosphoribosyl)-5-[(5-phosphoribosylamino)methylideneamino]imidazole-4-carboxamide isomerase [Candidatus Omnitrophota bacterium]MDD5550194.1 1-(5-phosphoribosyl)-5-[(5-phosphoribosylamino)methylideneamino]imidazole-4-carboxamide isomerase [Candidatus Omnitrophota bacterium]
MIIIPAIDLKEGKVVRLTQGDFDKVEEYKLDPVETARYFSICGAEWIHVVDLEGAKKGKIQKKSIVVLEKIIKEVNKYGVCVQFGGGIRSLKDVEDIFKAGASRVVLGTLALDNIKFLKKALADYADKIAVSLDAKNRVIVKKGWTQNSKKDISIFLQELETLGLRTLIYTNIMKDGMLNGPDFKGIENILKLTEIPVIASGGVSGPEDIKKLKKLESKGLCGVIVGKALYKGKIDLKEAIKLC